MKVSKAELVIIWLWIIGLCMLCFSFLQAFSHAFYTVDELREQVGYFVIFTLIEGGLIFTIRAVKK